MDTEDLEKDFLTSIMLRLMRRGDLSSGCFTTYNMERSRLRRTIMLNNSASFRSLLSSGGNSNDNHASLFNSFIDSDVSDATLTTIIPSLFRPRGGNISNCELIPSYLRLDGELPAEKGNIYNGVLTNYNNVEFLDKIVVKMDADMSEFVIGFYAVNKLRSEIPNFALTYGRVEDMNGENSYLIIEKINNTVSSEDFLKRSSYSEICLLILQVYSSLMVARERLQFSHYDLHVGNVLIRIEEKNLTVNYHYGGEDHPITSKFTPVIIDYGFSISGINGVKVSSESNIFYSNQWDEPKIETDLYRYFMTVMLKCKSSIVKQFQWVYDIFSAESGRLKEALTKQGRYYYYKDNKEVNKDTEGARKYNTFFYYPFELQQDEIDVIMSGLVSDATKVTSEQVYTFSSSIIQRRNIIRTVLDFYEDYPQSNFMERDVDKVLHDAYLKIMALEFERNKTVATSRKIITMCKLYCLFYAANRDKIMNRIFYKEMYSRYMMAIVNDKYAHVI